MNFVGNAIDLGTTISSEDFEAWMCPQPSAPSFPFPADRLIKFHSTIPDYEIYTPTTRDENNNPCIMVIKRGYGSGLTVGRLNTIRSIIRSYFKNKPGKASYEVSVLRRNSQSGPFAARGDSGSVAVDGKGRVAGLITAGTPRCTYLTSVNFLLKRMSKHGLEADLSPSLDASLVSMARTLICFICSLPIRLIYRLLSVLLDYCL